MLLTGLIFMALVLRHNVIKIVFLINPMHEESEYLPTKISDDRGRARLKTTKNTLTCAILLLSTNLDQSFSFPKHLQVHVNPSWYIVF